MCSKDIKRQSFSLRLLGCVSKLIFAIISSKKQQHVGFQIEDRFPCEIQPYMFPGLMNKESPRQRDIVSWACCLLNPHFQSLPSLNIAWPSPPHIWKLLELSRNQSILIYLYFPAKKEETCHVSRSSQSAHEILMARPEPPNRFRWRRWSRRATCRSTSPLWGGSGCVGESHDDEPTLIQNRLRIYPPYILHRWKDLTTISGK